MMKAVDQRKKYFEDFFYSASSKVNLLTSEEYENSVSLYDAYYGDFLPVDKDAAILDVGCGTGHFLYFLKRSGYTNFFGIDLSPGNIDHCLKKITRHVMVADAFTYLRKRKNKYRVISANAVLEHVSKDNVLTFLQLIYRALKKEGILLMLVPNMGNPFSMQLRYRDFTHDCGFTEHSIYQILYLADFRDINIKSSWIDEGTFKAYIRKKVLKKLFWFLGNCNAPEVLSSLLIVMARK